MSTTPEQRDGGADVARQPSSAETTVSFEVTLGALLSAAAVDNKQLAMQKMVEMDRFFAGGEDAVTRLRAHIQTIIMPQLRQHPRMLTPLNFVSSMIQPASTFYRLFIDALAAEQENLVPDEIAILIEAFRRAEEYDTMRLFSDELEPKMERTQTSDQTANRLRAKRDYEGHMMLRQQAQKEQDPTRKRALYEQSLDVGMRSAQFARDGKDPVGEGYAYMSVAGAVYPALGREDEGATLLEQWTVDMEKLADQEPDTQERDRILRAVMSMRMHRAEIAIKRQEGIPTMLRLLREVRDNTIYQLGEGREWVGKFEEKVLPHCEERA